MIEHADRIGVPVIDIIELWAKVHQIDINQVAVAGWSTGYGRKTTFQDAFKDKNQRK